MGRTEFLTPTIRSEPWVGKRKPTKRAKWRSFYECMQECAQNLVDTADIVRDGDVTTSKPLLPVATFVQAVIWSRAWRAAQIPI